MIKIFVAFLPWAVFWSSAYSGDYRSGVLWGLVLSGILNLIHLRRFKIFETAAFFFFLVVFFLHFPDASFWIALSYFYLSLISLLPLFVNTSFIFQYMVESYPPAYRKDGAFLLINNIIAGVWGVIFWGSAVAVAVGQLVLPGILTIGGIAFSLFFPKRASAYFVSREFKKYDWNIKMNPARKKQEDEYDVIVVGAGIGGLTAGVLLSKRGCRVLMLEQHSKVGGYWVSFRRRDFTFSAGVIDVSGLWEKGPVAYLLREAGLKKEDFFVRNTVKYFLKGREIAIPPGLEGTVKVLSSHFPDEEESISRFFEEAKMAYEECYREAGIFGAPLPPYLLAKAFGGEKVFNYPREHPHFYNYLNKTFKDKLDEFFKNENLKSLLGGLWGYTGAPPEKTSALMGLTVWMSYLMHGGYFPRGGPRALVDVLHDFIQHHGGEVLTGQKVDQIVVENKTVRGIKAGGRFFKSPLIAADANARTVFLELVGEGNLGKKFVSYIKGLKMSISCLVVYLGIEGDLSRYPVLMKDVEGGYEIVVISNADKNLAPAGKSAALILTSANYYDFPPRGTKEYAEKKKELAAQAVRKAEKLIPGLGERVIFQEAATPRTMERYVLMPEGALYSFEQSVEVERPYFKTPVKGLYLVGASTFPGGGTEGAVISGIICAQDICGWKRDKA
ncbi:NAD(P)/FAD-dependent oxidoreductase [Candidatus Saganbacteria bacterium]|uniref:NAD(P)/FAD-dependent oxidoreductase n=1 Tax=Candidatus Saganbacteria bacterium TaxID=2575572 RepID=A0A9D6UMF4_UNCSA|nr:NAD(P)/FAD-dependent oxidoreductase [Candidatus Saganbacteria bacterium]